MMGRQLDYFELITTNYIFEYILFQRRHNKKCQHKTSTEKPR